MPMKQQDTNNLDDVLGMFNSPAYGEWKSANYHKTFSKFKTVPIVGYRHTFIIKRKVILGEAIVPKSFPHTELWEPKD